MGYPCIVCGTVYDLAYKAELCHIHLKYVKREPVNRVRLEKGLEREQGSSQEN